MDGDWSFSLYGENGELVQSGAIKVPSPWEACGYGKEGDKLKNHGVGVGRYERDFIIPHSWRGSDIYLTLEGISRYAKVWIDGNSAGDEAVGVVGRHKWNVGKFVKFGKKMRLRIDVDSRQRVNIDAILGAAQLNDYMLTPWGGLWGHVFFEARPKTRLEDVYVYSKISPKRVYARISLRGNPPEGAKIKLEVFDSNGRSMGKSMGSVRAIGGEGILYCEVPGAKLWSPDEPNLHVVRISMVGDGGNELDVREFRTGIREIKIRGHKIFLNGKRLYLFGYGDDHIYPEHIAMPSDKNLHLGRLLQIKAMGFNHVRHHSTIMPREYYEACDEIGMLPNAEFPIGYPLQMPMTKNWENITKGSGEAAKALALYKERFEEVVRQYRNYTCIFSWIGGNEIYMGKDHFPRDAKLMEEFRNIAANLDAERLFSDTDGEWFNYILKPENDRELQQIYYVLFDEWADPLSSPQKYATRTFSKEAPLKPVVSHETGNYTTFSRPSQLHSFANSAVKPFWLIDAYQSLCRRGMLSEAEKWAEASEKLYMLLHKYNMEAIRKNADISGYHWWLIQDYWTSSDGIFDTHFRLKGGISVEEVANINSRMALLQEGLKFTYSSGEEPSFEAIVANYSGKTFNSALKAEVLVNGKVEFESSIAGEAVEHGDVKPIGKVRFPKFFDVTAPKKLEFKISSKDAKWKNSWTAWLFPGDIKLSPNAKVFADGGALKIFPQTWNLKTPDFGKIDANSTYILSSFDDKCIKLLRAGARVVLLDAGGFAKAIPIKFKSDWWRAGSSDLHNHTGTYGDSSNPIVGDFMPDYWCDSACLKLLNGARKYIVESLNVDNIVRGLSSMLLLRDYSILFGAKVGEGVLIVSGFNHAGAGDCPANLWLMKKLLESDWTPSKNLNPNLLEVSLKNGAK